MGKPRKSKEPWELLYDVTSAGEAEMIRLLFEATGVKYTNVKLGPSEIPDDSINIEYTNIPQEGGSDCSKESIKKGDNSNEEDLDHKGKLPRVAKGKLPRMAKGKQRKRGLSQVSDGTRESQCETGPSAAKKAKVLIDGGRLPYPRLPVIRKGDVEISHVVSILRYLAELYGVCPESHEDKLLADQIVQYCWDYWTEGRFVIAGNAFTKNDPPLAQGRQHYVDIFTKERMPMWLKFFEECLKKTMDGKKFDCTWKTGKHKAGAMLFANVLKVIQQFEAIHSHSIPVVFIRQDPLLRGPGVISRPDNHHASLPSKSALLLKDYRVRVGSASCVRTYIRSDRMKLSGYFFNRNYLL